MNPNHKINNEEEKYSQIEKIISLPDEETILDTASSENALYILNDKNKFLIHEKNSNSNIQINIEQNIKSNNQFKEKNSRIWCNNNGDHVLIRTNNSLFYYNPLVKKDLNLKEINFWYKNEYYLEPYSIAFNEEFNSKTEFEILVTDFFSDIYNVKIKILDNNDIKIIFLEKIFSFKSNYDSKEKEIDTDKENDFDFNLLDLIHFDKDERIIDIQTYINPYRKEDIKEKLIIACTKSMLFIFRGNEYSFQEIFKKYLSNPDLLLKSYKKFPYNKNFDIKTHLQIISSYTEEGLKSVFGYKLSIGYCIGEINNELNNIDNIYIIKANKPKYVGDKKIPLFVFDEEPIEEKGLIMSCQTKLYIYILYDNCLLMLNKLTKRYVHYYSLTLNFKDLFYSQFNQNIYLTTEKEIFRINCNEETKYIWKNYIEIEKYDLALKYVSIDDDILKAKIHKIKADNYFSKKMYEKAAEEYFLSNEKFEHVCYIFLKEGNMRGLIIYLQHIKKYILNDNIKDNNKINENFINKYLLYTWLAILLINEEKDNKKFLEEFKTYQKDKYLNKQTIYHFLTINLKEKDLNDFAILKHDHKIIIQNLIFKGKYEEAFDYLEKNLGTGKSNIDEGIKAFMKYFDIFMKKSVKNTIRLLENINFSKNDAKQVINAIMGTDYEKYRNENEEKNYNIIVNYLKKIVYENITSTEQNKNLNNLFLLFLSFSKKPENKKEIINYLKSPLNTFIIKDNKIISNFSNKKIFIDLNFGLEILKEIPQALALIYYYMEKYEKSIDILLEKNEDELIIQIAQNIKNFEKKKKTWMKLFQEYKKTKKYTLKEILELSNGTLKIEDILQFLDSEVKLKEIKSDLQSCIDVYEKSVSSIKQNIITFNKSNNIIQEDIFKTKKKKFELIHQDIKCRRCGNQILDNKFFLYPCGHIFDVECLVKILIEYEEKGIGNEDFKGRVKAVKNLSQKIMNMQKKKTIEKKNVIMGELSKFGKKMKKIMTLVKIEQKEEKEKNEEEVELSKEEELQLKELSNGLYDLLKIECVLCGQEMINSTQIMFGKNNDNDEDKWKNLVE